MVFTAEELRKYDGRGGRPCYIAYKGLVYDVTESTFWEYGEHLDEHSGGGNLTQFIDDAPHGEDVFEDFPVVGEFEE
jgi:predicted heme/steroid binding protein